jgi:hypothetical protein
MSTGTVRPAVEVVSVCGEATAVAVVVEPPT